MQHVKNYAKNTNLSNLFYLLKNLLYNSIKYWFLGNKAKTLVSSWQKSIQDIFYPRVKAAFIQCSEYLQKTMPLDNTVLKVLSTLDPAAVGHSSSMSLMLQIPSLTSTIISIDEKDAFEIEVRHFHLNSDDLPSLQSNQRIDNWWHLVSQTKQYPLLCKASLALLTCFHGPKVESCFSEMNDILDPQSSRMHVETLSALHTIRYRLKSNSKVSIKYFARNDPAFDPIDPALCTNFRLASKRRVEEQEKRQIDLQVKKNSLKLSATTSISKNEARKVSAKLVKCALKSHHSQAKRIKLCR